MAYTRYASLAGQTVVVTGGATGIGEAFVRAFVENDARVAFLDLQADAGTALATATGARFVACDLTDVAALRRALDQIHDALGPAAALVNNAANDQRHDFLTVTPDQFDATLAVNLRHVYFASQAVVPQMRARGGGSIINLSSVAWMIGVDDLEAYTAAKAAIVGFTNTLARRVGKDRIRVNAIAPGMVLTERQLKLWFQDERALAQGLARQCLPDRLLPPEIANMALFLAADDGRMITKQCFSVNAGIH